MVKIQMRAPLVEMEGDEMARILWKMVKVNLLEPYIDLNTEYYDLSLSSRDETDDRITLEAAEAVKAYGVGVKCATIAPNARRVKEYDLKRMYDSPDATLSRALGGTLFCTPIALPCFKAAISAWESPVTLAVYAGGGLCGDAAPLAGENGEEEASRAASIRGFARACFDHALELKQSLWFGDKDDGRYNEIFEEVYEKEFEAAFESQGLSYNATTLAGSAARALRANGGFVWAVREDCDGVLSALVAAAFSSAAMMQNTLVSPLGAFAFKAAHGTAQRHYEKHLRGELTSVNPIGTLFAWTGALYKRGELDGLDQVRDFAKLLEKAALKTLQEGYVTHDLKAAVLLDAIEILSTEGFILKIRENLDRLIIA